MLSKRRKLPSSKLDSLKKAKLIYVGGGDQVIFMDIINNLSRSEKYLERILRKGQYDCW